MIELRVLGPPRVLRDGEPIALQPKRLALFAYLALTDRGVLQRRDALLGVFWPEQDTTHARASLRQALRGIRRALGEDSLVTRGDEEVGVDTSQLVVDVDAFNAALADPDDAIRTYDGPFLQGFHLGGCPEFEHWVESERERFARAFADAVERAAHAATARGDHAAAATEWRRLRLNDPFSARAVVGLMRALSAAGNRAAAIDQFERYRNQLRRDLELEPEPDVVAVVRRLKKRTGELAASGEEGPSDEHEATSQREVEGSAVETRSPRLVFKAAGLAAAVVVVALGISSMMSRTSLRKNHLAVFPARVIPIEADAYLETGVANLLDMAFDGAGGISTVDHNRLLPVVERAGGAAPSIDEAVRLSRDMQASLFVLSNIMRVDTTLHITVRLYDVEGREEPVAEAKTTGSEHEIWDLVHSLALDIVTQLPVGEGYRLSDLSGVRPANYAALKAYLQGVHAFRVATPPAAIEAFDRAIAADSTFGLAWYRKSVAEGWANHAEARKSMRRARDLTNELSERDSLFVEAWYAMWWDDPDRADSLSERITQLYPDHVEAWHARGKYLQFFGWRHGFHPNAAEAAFRKALELDPGHPPAAWGLGVVLNKLQRPVEGYGSLERNLGWVAAHPADGPGALIRAIQLPDPAGDPILDRLTELRPADIEFATRITASAQSFSGAETLARSLTEPHRPSDYRALGHLHLAHLTAARGRWTEALEHFDDVALRFPQTALVYRAILTASPFVARPRDELEATRESLRVWSGTFDEDVCCGVHGVHVPPILRPHVRAYLLGIVEGRLGNGDVADAYADTLMQAAQSADSLDLLHDLSIELQALGELARGDTVAALKFLEQSKLTVGFDHWVSPFHKRWYGTFLRAELLSETSRDEEALGWYSGFGPGNETVDYVYFPWSRFRRGQIFDRLGEPDSAVAHYRVFVSELAEADEEYQAIVDSVEHRLDQLLARRN